MRVEGGIVVVIAAHDSRWLHHAGNFQSGNSWPADGKKQALDLRGQLQVLQEAVTVLLNCSRKCFSLLDIPLDEVNNKGETHRRREIMEDSKRRVDNPRGVIIMEQDTNSDETVADIPA